MPDGSRRSSSMSPSIPGGGEHSEAARLVAVYPMLPAQGRHPQPVDQDDGVGGGRVGGIFGGHGILLTLMSFAARRKLSISLKAELGRVHDDHHQALIPVSLGPRAAVGKLA